MIGLNHFSNITKKDIIKVILAGFIIPNLAFWVVDYFLDFNRAVINIDYLIPLLLMTLLPLRFANLISFFVFFVVFSIDILLVVLQFFPFIKLADIVYLSGFLFTGPITYRFYFIYLILWLLIEYVLINKIIKQIKLVTLLLPFTLIILLQGILVGINYQNDKNNHTLVTSEIIFLARNYNNNFFKLKNLQPLLPTNYQNASKSWFDELSNNQKLSKKLLLIVNESWGYPLNDKIQAATLAKLKLNTNIEFFKQGAFPVLGATLGGELRELCQLDPQLLDIAKVNEGFSNCLPNKLQQQGYHTVAIHGSDDLILYNREHWYPLAGFQQISKGTDFNLIKDPGGVFGAVSDLDLLPIIADSFKQNPQQFLYWMTITTHAPYSKESIRNKRFSCRSFDLNEDSDSCHLLILQTQFFDGLNELINRPEMKGVEVIVAGDHPPPLLSFSEGIRVFAPSKVSWIHFKVKDEQNDKQE